MFMGLKEEFNYCQHENRIEIPWLTTIPKNAEEAIYLSHHIARHDIASQIKEYDV